MTPATLRKLECHDGRCAVCGVDMHPSSKNTKHAPDCELDAGIREAEQAEKGERPEIRAGDVVVDYIRARTVSQHDATWWNTSPLARPVAIYRDPLWRQEPPTHAVSTDQG